MKRSYARSMESLGIRKRKAQARSFYYESKQTVEEPVTKIKDLFTCRYAYGRAAESVMLSEMGQDFIALKMNEDVCHFVLCDGVGLSYRGDVASRLLGQGLMNWLETVEELTTASLERRLKELTQEADREMRTHSLSSETPCASRSAGREARKGSEAMYICGRIELSSGFAAKEDCGSPGRVTPGYACGVRKTRLPRYSEIVSGRRNVGLPVVVRSEAVLMCFRAIRSGDRISASVIQRWAQRSGSDEGADS